MDDLVGDARRSFEIDVSVGAGRNANTRLQLDRALVFFDVAGTLCNQDESLSSMQLASLRRLARRVYRFVLVTGQPTYDPQVQQILLGISRLSDVTPVAYTTRGGVRLTGTAPGMRRDFNYLQMTQLERRLRDSVMSEIRRLVAETNLQPRLGPRCIENVAVRVNLKPEDRPEFVSTLNERLAEIGLTNVRAVAEGRTSVFVMRDHIGKSFAVQHELEDARAAGFCGAAFYFGDEFVGGNDEEVMKISGLNVCALGNIDELEEQANFRRIGSRPEEVYQVIDRSMSSTAPIVRLLSVCVSLGGTKLQVAALTTDGSALVGPEIFWRSSSDFALLGEDQNADRFCALLADLIVEFLTEQGFALADAGVVGVAFPGPQKDSLWFSNNLTPAFERGVPLEESLARALRKRQGQKGNPCVRVLLDAQCDAGGEVHHPQGRMFGLNSPTGTVVNMATGIAAGFIFRGAVVIKDDDFQRSVHANYDSGAGQLGRHLWYLPTEDKWTYEYCPQGQTPTMDSPGVRLTERLGGPAIAARMLLMLGAKGMIPSLETRGQRVTPNQVAELYNHMIERGLDHDTAAAARMVRALDWPLSTPLLEWADITLRESESAAAEEIAIFAQRIAAEFAGALRVWMNAPGWNAFGRHVVLAGGVGSRFLASCDDLADRSFLRMLETNLPVDCHIERSRLRVAAERECHLFVSWPFDAGREEVRLAGVVEQLRGRFRFQSTARRGRTAFVIDVEETSEVLALGGRSLRDFIVVPPGDSRVRRPSQIEQSARVVAPEEIAVVILCGGLGTRSGGSVHPLLPIGNEGPSSATLLDLQLQRLARSPLAGAAVFLAASPHNAPELYRHLDKANWPNRPSLFTGGLVPRLTLDQTTRGDVVPFKDRGGHVRYSPAGHLDAIRWLVVGGALARILPREVIVIASYSNFGHIFSAETLSFAAHAAEWTLAGAEGLFMVEVTERTSTKRTGSMLATLRDSFNLVLVKHEYGKGEPSKPGSGLVLMSTNTLYFGVRALMRRLRAACHAAGLTDDEGVLEGLLESALQGHRRAELAAIFDAAFPVGPILTPKVVDGRSNLQAERQLDQLSLIPGLGILEAVEVGAERAVSIKLPSDLEDPAKRQFLGAMT